MIDSSNGVSILCPWFGVSGRLRHLWSNITFFVSLHKSYTLLYQYQPYSHTVKVAAGFLNAYNFVFINNKVKHRCVCMNHGSVNCRRFDRTGKLQLYLLSLFGFSFLRSGDSYQTTVRLHFHERARGKIHQQESLYNDYQVRS